METLTEWTKEKSEAALREQGKWEGKAEAFKEVQERLNPEVYCQGCGQRYYGKTDKTNHKCPAANKVE